MQSGQDYGAGGQGGIRQIAYMDEGAEVNGLLKVPAMRWSCVVHGMYKPIYWHLSQLITSILMNKTSKATASLSTQALEGLQRLGQRLRANRLEANWTVEQTAERLLCSPTTYRALEAGKPTVSLGLLVNALWIFGRLDDLDRIFPLGEWLIENRRARRGGGIQAGIRDDERNF